TKGGAGLANATIPNFKILPASVLICGGGSATITLSPTGTVPAGTIFYWYNQAVGGTLLNTGTTYTTPSLSANTTYYIATCPGFYRTPIEVTVDLVTTNFTSTTVCEGSVTAFTGSGFGTAGAITGWAWNFGDGSGTSTQQNPSYTYASAGTYTVTLTATDNNNCTASVSHTVTVSPRPSISFSATATTGCGSAIISFVNNTTNASTYSWNFGDGTAASTLTAPSHTYTSAGTYTVTLTATGSSGCTSTSTQSGMITVYPQPTASFASTNNVCLGDTIFFTNLSNGNGGFLTAHSWNFGDGTPLSSLTNPYHVFTTAGSFSVQLVSSTIHCSDDTIITVNIAPAPQVNFSPSPAAGCGPLTVSFTNTTSGSPVYTWNFGDGSPSSSLATPSHTYATAGTYTVTLIATQGSCADTLSSPSLISVYQRPTAIFSSSTTVCLGDTFFFNNTSTGNGATITGYSWNFGDGSPASTAAQPYHVYSASGSYSVVLTASTANCSDDSTRTITVSPAPQVNFSAAATSGCNPFSVSFSNTTTSSPVYSWNFGDGSPLSSTTSPTHLYTSPGTYTVTLIASQGSCADTLVRTNYITAYPTPTASFTSNNNVCLGDTIFFINSSSGNGSTLTSHTWNFGDGSPASALLNPFHVFTAAGTYSVQLTSASSNCADDTTIQVTVAPAPVVAFSATVTSGCNPLTVNFTNTTTGSPLYSWNFGDGSPVSSLVSPAHTYTSAGTYSVTLIATQGSCADTLVIPSMISVEAKPTSSCIAPLTICLGDTINFINTSVGNGSAITGYTWNFGDGTPSSSLIQPSHVFSSSGNFSVTLTTFAGTCVDDTTIVIAVNPAPQVNFTPNIVSGCGPQTVLFTNATTGSPLYSWNFGDGSPLSSVTNPSHLYTNSGTYTVTLIATQGTCGDTLIRSNLITISPVPTASFNTTNVCLGDSVHFSNSSTGNGGTITAYSWNFGDGSPASAIANPAHLYASAGSFAVTLTASSALCSDDSTFTVVVSPAPQVQFSSSVTSGCSPVSVAFTNTTTGSPVYSWNFGDGSSSSSLVAPVHTYTNAGIYSVTLIATQGSCADTLVVPNMISVQASPISDFSAGTPCFGDTLYFTNNSLPNGTTIVGYTWNFGDGSPLSSQQDVAHFYNIAGSYTVTLVASGSGGCSDTTVQTVNVLPRPTVSFSTSTTNGCDSLTVNFLNTTTGANTYNWFFGDGNTSALASPTHTYNGPGTYSIGLTATAPGGCSATRSYVNYIVVRSSPVVQFSSSASSICPGDCISFSDQSGSSITGWQWTFTGANPSSAAVANPAMVCYPSIGTFDVGLTVTDGYCTGTNTLSGMVDVVNCSQLPKANFISSDTSLCGGACISFVSMSLNATGWQWSFPGASPSSSTAESPAGICYSTPGNYSVTLIVSNAAGTDTLRMINFIQVNANPPTPSFSQNGDTLTSSIATFYQWYFNGIPISGATSQQFVATLSGNYTVSITDGKGCVSTAPPRYVSLVGIDEVDTLPVFYIYPNPASEQLNVLLLANKTQKASFFIIDALGQVLFSREINISATEQNLSINCSSFSPGLYWIRLTVQGRSHNRKVLIH
ncbi:MAG TPA: PKD domain-containing protein, partial [Bacteroidia bacterium]|nr:PKD domain-containing protein [Bacteroidia bacterium]